MWAETHWSHANWPNWLELAKTNNSDSPGIERCGQRGSSTFISNMIPSFIVCKALKNGDDAIKSLHWYGWSGLIREVGMMLISNSDCKRHCCKCHSANSFASRKSTDLHVSLSSLTNVIWALRSNRTKSWRSWTSEISRAIQFLSAFISADNIVSLCSANQSMILLAGTRRNRHNLCAMNLESAKREKG